MTDVVEVTEMIALDADRVDGVRQPANGTSFLLLKAVEDEGEGAGADVDTTEKGASGDTVINVTVNGDVKSAAELGEAVTAALKDSAAGAVITPAAPVILGDGIPELVVPIEKADGELDTTGDVETPDEPGSPEWEAADGDALTAVATELARLAAKLGISLDREWAEVQAGEADDYRDVDQLSYAVDCVNTALSLVAGLAFREAVEGETEAAEKSIRPDLSEAFTKARDTLTALLGDTPAEEATMDLPTMTGLVKSATDDDATDEQKEQLATFRKALGLDDVATKEDLAAEITKATDASAERDTALEADLAEVKKAAAPGGPVKTRTTAQQNSADKVSELQLLKAARADVQEQFVKSTDPGWSEVLRTNLHELDEQIATATAALT
jgi:hypothetical protein